jgi:hypothetical protein
MTDIINKEIPKLLFEIMSCFYKEESFIPYIDKLINILNENDTF